LFQPNCYDTPCLASFLIMPSVKTTAVVVSFNPDPEIVEQMLIALQAQCHTVIIDNGSSQSSLFALQELAAGFRDVDVLCLEENSGIAHAQNVAINHIIDTRSNSRYILLLDHDSIPDSGMVSTLEETFEALVAQGKSVAAVGPVLYDPRDDKHLDFHKTRYGIWGKIRVAEVDDASPVVEVDSLNSSGTLLATGVYRETGGFDDSLFIDHVETDWCFRARHSGYRLFATTQARLTHHMGDDVCFYWLFGRRRMPYRSPFRHYYIVRNSILLQRRGYVPMSWKFSNILKLLFTTLYFGYYYQDSRKQRKQIFRGIFDGLKGITGRQNNILANNDSAP